MEPYQARRTFTNRILNDFTIDEQAPRDVLSLPKTFTNLIYQMYKEADKLKRMAMEDIPSAVPITEPIANPVPKYASKHSPEEYIGSVSKVILEDALFPMEICSDLKESIEGALFFLENLYPRNIENGMIRVEATDDFKNVLERLKRIDETVLKIQQLLLRTISSSSRTVIDVRQLRALRAHVIKIGWDMIHNHKLPHELFPEELYDEMLQLTNPTRSQEQLRDNTVLHEFRRDVPRASCDLDPNLIASLLEDDD